MFRTDETLQEPMFVRSVRDFVPANSDVYLYVDLFELLDVVEFESDYSPAGEAAIHPTLMLRSIFYGLTHGIASGHKLAAMCKYDARFMILCGEQSPDRRTFDRFLTRHVSRIEALFAKVVQLAQKMGLVSLGRVAIDGSHFKANTSKNKAMSYEYMVKAVQKINEELKQLRASLKEENALESTIESGTLSGEIALREIRLAKIEAAKKALEEEARIANSEVNPKAQKSFHDLEALPAKKGKKEFQYAYNMQTAVDDKNQIIVACEMHENVSDKQALVPVLDAVKENCGEFPEIALADAGYKSASNAAALEDRNVLSFIAMGKGETETGELQIEQFEFDIDRGKYRCPKGKLLPTNMHEGGAKVQVPRGHCIGCSLIEECPLFAKQGCSVSLPPEKHRAALARVADRMRTDEGKGHYKRRKAIVEAPFGNMKNKGMKILVKGKDKVKTRFKMFATAHNIEKIIGSMMRSGIQAASV